MPDLFHINNAISSSVETNSIVICNFSWHLGEELPAAKHTHSAHRKHASLTSERVAGHDLSTNSESDPLRTTCSNVDCLSMMCELNFQSSVGYGRAADGGVAVGACSDSVLMDALRTCCRPQCKIFLHLKIMNLCTATAMVTERTNKPRAELTERNIAADTQMRVL